MALTFDLTIKLRYQGPVHMGWDSPPSRDNDDAARSDLVEYFIGFASCVHMESEPARLGEISV